MTGSGTAAVESMIAGPGAADGRLLVVENGVYGERIAQMCAQYGIAHERWTRLDAARRIWRSSPRVSMRPGPSRMWRWCITRRPRAPERSRGARRAVPRAGRAFAGRRRQQLRRRADRFLPTPSRRRGGDGEQVPARRAGRVVRDRAARCAGARREPHLLPRSGRLARLQDQRNTPFTPAVHAYYALVEALREFADEGGGAPATRLRGAGRAGARGAGRAGHRAACCRRSNRRWCCVRTVCRTASAIRSCTTR